MGLWGWVEHTATSAWHGIERAADATWDGLTTAAHWIGERWKPLVAALAAGVAFALVFTFCPAFGPALLMELAPSLLPAVLAGLVSGATGQAMRDLLAGKKPGTDLIVPALLSAVLSGGGMAAGRLALAVPFVARTAPLAKGIATVTGANASEGAASLVPPGFRGKIGFIAVNVTPGPADIVHIVEGPSPTPDTERAAPPPSPTKGLLGALDAAR